MLWFERTKRRMVMEVVMMAVERTRREMVER